MKLNLSLILLIFIITSIIFAQPNKSILIVTDYFVNFTETNGTGLCFDIINLIYKQKGYKINYLIVPYDRSKTMIEEEKADIIVGLYPNEIENVIYPKYHIFVDDISAIYLKNKTVIKNINDLRNKKVGWLIGYEYNKFIDIPMNFIEVEENSIGVKMVEKERIDCFLAPVADFDFEIDTNKFEIKFLKWIKTYNCFVNNEKGKELAKIWDKEFEKLLKDGTIKKIFKKYDSLQFYQYNIK